MDISTWIYDLRPDEFEEFVAGLLQKSGFSDVRLVGGPQDKGIDILAKQDGETIAIQVKHRKELRPAEIERFIDHYLADDRSPRNILLVTSAKITPQLSAVLQKVPHGLRIRLLGLDDLQALMINQSDVVKKFIYPAQRRKSSSRRQFLISFLGGLVSIIGLLITALLPLTKHKEPLDQQIKTVETALQSIRDLESHLAALKEDMVAKEKATQEINEKYAKARELKKLTDAQLEALKSTLQAEKWWRTLLQYGLGFILGISSSFVASILHARWKQRRALSSELEK
ncbi:restriction endonuclease [bacterium]|nr:restriction endonuclease [bacterium]